MVNVDFEWFDPQPAVDFHGLKNLLRQLFDNDAQIFDLSALADLILSQPTLGSTVKTDGNESDPYAFLTVLNLQEHKVNTPELYIHNCPELTTLPGQTSHSGSDQVHQEQSRRQPLPLRPQRAHLPDPSAPDWPDPERASDQHAVRGRAAHVQHVAGGDGLGCPGQ